VGCKSEWDECRDLFRRRKPEKSKHPGGKKRKGTLLLGCGWVFFERACFSGRFLVTLREDNGGRGGLAVKGSAYSDW